MVGRRGGDEFVALLAEVDDERASLIVERIRVVVAALRLGSPPIGTTASFGIRGVRRRERDRALPGARLTPRLYVAKASGGNSVVLSRPSAPSSGALAGSVTE